MKKPNLPSTLILAASLTFISGCQTTSPVDKNVPITKIDGSLGSTYSQTDGEVSGMDIADAFESERDLSELVTEYRLWHYGSMVSLGVSVGLVAVFLTQGQMTLESRTPYLIGAGAFLGGSYLMSRSADSRLEELVDKHNKKITAWYFNQAVFLGLQTRF